MTRQSSVTTATSLTDPLRCYQQNRALILDYSLAAAILGLSPVLITLITVAVGILALKMMGDIAVNWGLLRRWHGLAIAANLLSAITSLASALLAWVSLTVVGLYVPVIHRFDLSAAFFTLMWMIGNATNVHHLNRYPRTIAIGGEGHEEA